MTRFGVFGPWAHSVEYVWGHKVRILKRSCCCRCWHTLTFSSRLVWIVRIWSGFPLVRHFIRPSPIPHWREVCEKTIVISLWLSSLDLKWGFKLRCAWSNTTRTMNEHFSRFVSITGRAVPPGLWSRMVNTRPLWRRFAQRTTHFECNDSNLIFHRRIEVFYVLREISCHKHYEPWLNCKLLYAAMQPIMDLHCASP